MLVNHPDGGPDDGPVTCIAQAEHARHAGRLAQELDDAPQPRGPFEDATACHDDGWKDYDRDPGWNEETGLPHTYRSIPTGPYVDVWRRGLAEARDRAPYVELLVSLHGTPFLARRDAPEAEAFVEEQRARQDDLLEELDHGGSWDDLPEPVATHRAWMGFLDALSLFVLDRWDSPWRAEVAGETVEARRSDWEATVDPWPFRPSVVEATVPVVILEDAPYESPEAMGAGLASATRGRRTVTLVEAGGSGDPPTKA